MKMFPKREKIDYAPFAKDNEGPSPKYGLPAKIRFCNRCVISNQRPNSAQEFSHTSTSLKTTTHIDDSGVCDACHFADEKKRETDWDDRESELRELCDRFRRDDGHYDCLVPGSGGKDSFFAAHILKEKYGMNPLTITWAPHMYTDWGWKNFQSWIHAGFDNYLFTPNGRVHRLLTRLAVENIFHPFQPFMIGQKAFAPKLAAKLNIPLVFFGENEGEYGNPIDDTRKATRSWDYFASQDLSKVFLGGTSVKDLKSQFGLSAADLEPYMPVNPQILTDAKVEVHFLGYYLRWHPQSNYYYARENSGFRPSPERTPGTFTKFVSIDDKIDDFHFYTAFIKFGIGRATYEACMDIRTGDISREEAIHLVRKYDGEFPERFLNEIFNYLSIPEAEFPVASKMFEQPIMDRDYFDNLVDRFRSPHIWQRDNGVWKLRKTVWDPIV